MFASHLSQISIARKDPGPDFDVEGETRRIRAKFTKLAEKIVVESWLKSSSKKKVVSAEKKIRDLIEFDERMKSVKEFIGLWNYWREFYFDLPPIYPKTKSQLSSIEGAIKLVNDEDLNINIMIACVHRDHYVCKRKRRPEFSTILSYGIDAYHNHSEHIETDIDVKNYQRMSSE